MTWAQRLKRVFDIDIEIYSKCGGTVKMVACIEDARVIEKILTRLQKRVVPDPTGLRPESRASLADLFS